MFPQLFAKRPLRILSFSCCGLALGAMATPSSFAGHEEVTIGNVETYEVRGCEEDLMVVGNPKGAVPEGVTAGDWAEIRAVHNAFRYRAFKTATGYRASNPGQGWGIEFDGRGFLVQPESSDWSWGLQLHAYGYEGHQDSVKGNLGVSANQNRMTYRWDASVEEWYINDGRGLEHGYTLESRLKGAGEGCGSLVFDLAVRGSLHAEVLGNGHGVRFVNDAGIAVLTYSGLRVFDSANQDQKAVFTGGGRYVQIVIEETDALYPLTIDPIAQGAYLKASNTGPDDNFGTSVGVSGDRVVVGAIFEDSGATGVDGDGMSESATDSGSAYVFRKVGGGWTQEAYLKASNTDAHDWFGGSVAISGDHVVVGATREDGGSTGVNGDATLNNGHASGAAYVFRAVSGVWTQEAYLKASNAEINDSFGSSVAISGDCIVVGACTEDGSAAGVNGDETLNNAMFSGAAYVFRRTGGMWAQEAYLKPFNVGLSDQFGGAVGVSGDRIVVGATGEDSSATGVDGNGALNNAERSGAAYVFRFAGGVWAQEAYLKASNTGREDDFGISVGISGDLVVVGAFGEDSPAIGVDGDGAPNTTQLSGAAYVFRVVGGIWAQEAYLKASNTHTNDIFGTSVAASGDRVVVGARADDSASTGVDGTQWPTPTTHDSGAAFVFRQVGGVWVQEAYLKASNTGAGDNFGDSVAISGGRLVAGAPWERSSATGVDGNGALNNSVRSGAAYVFDLEAGVASFCQPGVLNSTGVPGVMSVSGSLVTTDNALMLNANGLPIGEFAFFLTSAGRDLYLMAGGSNGNLCLGGGQPIGRINASLQLVRSGGMVGYPLDLDNLPNPLGPVTVAPGETHHFQCWHRDGSGMSNFTDGISVRFE